MRTPIIATGIVLASGVLAAPHTATRMTNKVSSTGRRSGFRQHVDGISSSNGTVVEYSTNWAGAVINDAGFTSVAGTIIVPTAKDVKTYNGVSIWVGIDGNTCDSAILQTGLQMTINSLGTITYSPWYEWYPDFPYNYPDFPVHAGDEIRMSVTASSTSAGTAMLENLTTGDKVSQSFANETNLLCQWDAEWIVEDFALGPYLAPFAQFGSVTFTNASAAQNGQPVDLSDALILNIKQDDEIYTDCGLTDSSTVYCDYVQKNVTNVL